METAQERDMIITNMVNRIITGIEQQVSLMRACLRADDRTGVATCVSTINVLMGLSKPPGNGSMADRVIGVMVDIWSEWVSSKNGDLRSRVLFNTNFDSSPGAAKSHEYMADVYKDLIAMTPKQR